MARNSPLDARRGRLVVRLLLGTTVAGSVLIGLLCSSASSELSVNGAWLVSINAATCLCFAVDKALAAKGVWRLAERTLHALCWLGGTPAALISMLLFHHKCRKPSFIRSVAIIAGWQVVVLALCYLILAVA